MITVFPIDQKFLIKMDKGVAIEVTPLRQKQKNLINSACVSVQKGETFHDVAMSTFLTLKHSVKGISGLVDVEGKDYKLDFEKLDDYEVLTDDCVEALLNCELGYVLSFYSSQAIYSTPHKIINPVTKKPLDGVEFVPDKDSKKK